jgi:hypothetical protein
MARKPSGISTVGSPLAKDDFSLIKGIGPALSKRLYDSGINTYHRLSSLSPIEIAERVGGLSAKVITNQDWIGQAQKLDHPKIRSKHPSKSTLKQNVRQHYENFTIEVLLDEKKIVRRIRAVHIQGGDTDTWASWEPDKFIDFIARHTGLHISVKKTKKKLNSPVSEQAPCTFQDVSVPTTDITSTKKLSKYSAQGGVLAAEDNGKSNLRIETKVPETSKSSAGDIGPSLKVIANHSPIGILNLKDLKILTIDSTPIFSLHQGQPGHVQITLDLTGVFIPSDILLVCDIVIHFKQLGGAGYLVAEKNSIITTINCATMDMVFTCPPSGLYRPEAVVKLSYDKYTIGLMASLKGDLIQVF